jgi:DNA-binding NarL/FixJ family response regulator
MQLAAQAGEADGWIELSDPASRVTDLASSMARQCQPTQSARASSRVEHLSRTWRTLTKRQRQVLALLGCGIDNQKLANALGISERAVKAHVSALLQKFKADSRTELALIACHANLRPGARPRHRRCRSGSPGHARCTRARGGRSGRANTVRYGHECP